MDKRLDKYLQAVEAELRGLKEEKRQEELREMRQHLEAIVARLVEGGLSEAEAVEAACAQFGAPRSIGRAVKRVGQKTPLREMALASLATWATEVGFYGVGAWFFTKYPALVGSEGYLPLAWVLGIGPLCAGWLAESIAPRRGGLVAACAYTMMLAGYTLLNGQSIVVSVQLLTIFIACLGAGLRYLAQNNQEAPVAVE